MSMTLDQVIDRKRHVKTRDGFEPVYMPPNLFPHQEALSVFAIETGRGAVLADCGLGKSGVEAVCAENFARKAEKPVLVLTPLAVGAQWVREAERFGIEATQSKKGEIHRITVSSWTRLNWFNPDDFCAVIGDESSILKSFDGQIRTDATKFMRKVRWRVFGTANGSPNDFTELGTHSEALGYLGFMDMLNRFFKNDLNNSGTKRMYGEAPKWRFKGHAEEPFWRWVCSWARFVRKPSDLGFSDEGFILPPLDIRENLVESEQSPTDRLFVVPETTLPAQRKEKRRTLQDRCERAAELVLSTGKPFASWCQTNDESDLLRHLLKGDAVEVSGKDSDESKEDKFGAFSRGDERGLITKARIGAWGLNWQHCDHFTYFPSHSYEEYYQLTRRFWRFGQKNFVTGDIVLTEGEKAIMANLNRKQEQAERMGEQLVRMMQDALNVSNYRPFNTPTEVPAWLC